MLERTASGLAQGVIGTARGTLVRTNLVAHEVHLDTPDDAAACLWRLRHNAEFAAASRALAELLG